MVLERQFQFRNSKATYEGVPIMAANMDTTGTFEIAKCFAEHGLFVCIHKHYRYVYNGEILYLFLLVLTTGNRSPQKIQIFLKISL